MNREQYDALSQRQKSIATEAYIDGFRACLEQVKSTIVRVDELGVDQTFCANRDLIVDTLEHIYEEFLLPELTEEGAEDV